jgi:dTDP-4-amino-4,6-dideoxygalactose transaminase
MWSFKDHGKCWEAVYGREHPPGFRWLHESFGTNWRMIEIQGAIGRIQLRRMENWHRARLENARRIWAKAAECPGLRVPALADGVVHAAYKCYVFVDPARLAPEWNRDRIASEIAQAGVPCAPGSCSEIYLEKAFDGTGWRPDAPLPVARELGETSLMFLVHPTLSTEEIEKTCSVLQAVLASAAH